MADKIQVNFTGVAGQSMKEGVIGFALGSAMDTFISYLDSPTEGASVIDVGIGLGQLALTGVAYVGLAENMRTDPASSVNTLPLWGALLISQPGMLLRATKVARAVQSIFDAANTAAQPLQDEEDETSYY